MPLSLRVLLCLVLTCLGAGAAFVLGKTLMGRDPDAPRSSLERALDGGDMEQYLERPSEKKVLLEWINDGAPRDEWGAMESILEERCVVCHDGETMPRLVPLDRYGPASRVARVRPLLVEKIEWGTMERYLEGPGEKEALLEWMERGAPESQWREAGRILAERCVSCHNPETGVPGLVALDRYASVARVATLRIEEQDFLAVVVPIGVLIVVAAALQRLWGGRRATA